MANMIMKILIKKLLRKNNACYNIIKVDGRKYKILIEPYVPLQEILEKATNELKRL